MHGSFSSDISSWESFFMLAGTASATLIGLLFVAVSLHLDLIGESGAATVLSLARRTFTRFILVVIIALLFLVPHQDPRGLGLPLLAFGIVDVLRTLRLSRVVVSTPEVSVGLERTVTRLLLPVFLPLVSGIGLILVAATLLAGTTAYLYWMVPIVGVMLTNAATNAWDLMLGLARYKIQRTGGDAVPGNGIETKDSKDEALARGT